MTTQGDSWLAQAPTYEDYPDRGCQVAPRCQDCPLPQCKHDNPRYAQANGWFSAKRWEPIKADLAAGVLSKPEIAAKHGKTERTVFRIQERLRAQGVLA